MLQLQEYNFRVMHCGGKSNTIADCLTRVNVIDKEPGEIIINENELVDWQKFDDMFKTMIKSISCEQKRKPFEV